MSEKKTRLHSLPLVLIAILFSLLFSFSLLSNYSDPNVFSSFWTALSDILSYIGVQGALTSSLVFALSCVVALPCLISFLESERRIKSISVIASLILAWSATSRPFNVSVSPINSQNYNPPTVMREQMTVWYWLYEVIRYFGFWVALVLILSFVFQRFVSYSSVLPKDIHSEVSCSHKLIWSTAFEQLWKKLLPVRGLYISLRAKSICIIWGVMFLCWSPWLLLMYPTNIGPDTIAQLVWGRTHQAWDPSSRKALPSEYWMSDHHPWFDTIIYTSFDKLGLYLGNENYGLWLLAIVTTITITFTLSLLICYCGSRMSVSWRICFILTVFCCVMPVYGRFMTAVMKDVTFLPFFILWTVLFLEYVKRIRNEVRLTPLFLTGFVFVALLCSLTKKTGMYIIIACLFVVLLCLKKRIFSAILLLVTPVLMIVATSVATPVLHIASGGSQEMFGVPLQQTSALLLSHGNDLSVSDKETIEQVVSCSSDELREKLNLSSSDPIKDGCFNQKASKVDLLKFLFVWVKQGILHPITYMSATTWITDPFVLGAVYENGYYVHWGWGEMGGNMILPNWKEFQVSPMQEIGQKIYLTLGKLPVFGLMMTEGLYVCWLPVLSIALCFALRRQGNIVYLLPVLISILTVAISPARQMRYTLTVVFLAVLIVAVPFFQDGTGTKSNSAVEQSKKELKALD